MARTRELQSLEQDVLWQLGSDGAWLRNDSPRVRRAINQSCAEFREVVSESGHPYYLRSTTGTLTVGATAPYHFGLLSLAALTPSHLRIYGFDIKVGQDWRTLTAVHFQDRNDEQPTLNVTGTPRQWFEFDRTNVAYSPASQSAYPYLVWDLPVHEDLDADDDTFDGLNGWEEWVIFNAAAKLLLRDRDSYLEAFQAERARLLAVVMKNAPQRQRAGPMVRDSVELERRGYRRRLLEEL
jgi:hypothetical protein